MTSAKESRLAPPKAAQAGSEDHSCTAQPLHRLATVRKQQGLSLRVASRHLGVHVREVRRQEKATTDLPVSQLYRWQKLLEVPLVDLLVDPGTPLSPPVLERARLVKLMKTVMSIKEHSTCNDVQRLAESMADELVDIMPELKDVGPWPSVGQRRSLDEHGQAAERCVSEDFLYRSSVE